MTRLLANLCDDGTTAIHLTGYATAFIGGALVASLIGALTS